MAGNKQSSILVLTGLTATGKTGLALQLARHFPVEIISADARQIYQGMDIGTGKIGRGDHLTQQADQWYLNQVPLHGINLISPDQNFSALNFARYAQQKISEITNRSKLPVFVGGTAFYLMSLFEPHPQQTVPPNLELRSRWQQQFSLATLSQFVTELQTKLAQINPVRLAQMNGSDRQNPRRLMRAIEIALAPEGSSNISTPDIAIPTPTILALQAPLQYLTSKIADRVDDMFSLGLESEVSELHRDYTWQSPGLQTIGYYEWQPYFAGQTEKKDVRNQIITHNRQYAKRQLTYLKKNPNIRWFDVSQTSEIEKIYHTCEQLLKKATMST